MARLTAAEPDADHITLGNAPTLRELIRVAYAMVDINCAGYAHAVTLDIYDAVDVLDGHQQLALFNALLLLEQNDEWPCSALAT